MKQTFKRRLSLMLAATMAFGSVAFAATANAADTADASVSASNGLPEKIEDGAILHCWCWSFNTIKENLPQIAAAGFKYIQTSPVNQYKTPKSKKEALKSSSNDNGNWWYQYQPTDYTIGNYMLGTEEEFKEMCEEAHKLGIKVIADIVANHCSSDYSAISSTIKSVAGKDTFHPVSQITDWSNREQVTQGHLTGLWDLNTQDSRVQQMIVDYTNRVLADGADGFRFDAAKHIELPDDDPKYAGNFWPTVLANDAEFQYAEVLVGADRAADYAKMVKITAEAYGANLRAALSKQKVTSATAKNYRLTGVDAGQLVTWVESHDTYCGDDVPGENKYSSWYTTTNEDINRGWAVICAQGDTTPLFYARPQGSGSRIEGGSSSQNFKQKWGDNTIGLAGDGNYYSNEVAAVNKFRNAMVGESKNLVDVVKGGKLTMIERGSKGAVLVSLSDTDTDINTATRLTDGEYTDQVSGETFTVANGKLSGTVKAGAIVVLYIPEEEPEVMIGDLNGDEKVDIQDITILQRHLAEFKNEDGTPIVDESNPTRFKVADFNCDGKIDVQDVTAMQYKVAEFAS